MFVTYRTKLFKIILKYVRQLAKWLFPAWTLDVLFKQFLNSLNITNFGCQPKMCISLNKMNEGFVLVNRYNLYTIDKR